VGVDAWTVAQAKAKFSEVIDKARSLGPQTITRNGRKAAVVVAAANGSARPGARGTWLSSLRRRPCGGPD